MTKRLSPERIAEIPRSTSVWLTQHVSLAELLGHIEAIEAELAELNYQLAEERNATANDRDPSYHEERLRRENEALAKQLEAVCVRMSSELGEMQSKLSRTETERDDLRAKLAEAEKTNSMLVGDNCELLKRAEAAEALAAKNDARANLLLADREAAEARVRELELSIRLIAAGNGNIRTENNR